jgi:hypothetical protein
VKSEKFAFLTQNLRNKEDVSAIFVPDKPFVREKVIHQEGYGRQA